MDSVRYVLPVPPPLLGRTTTCLASTAFSTCPCTATTTPSPPTLSPPPPAPPPPSPQLHLTACTRPACLPCLTRACAEHARTVLPSVDEPRRRDAKAGCAPLARPISLTPLAPRGHSHACGGPRSTPALAPPLSPPRHVVAVGALPYRTHPNSQPDPCRGSRGEPRECAAAAAVPRLRARPAHPGASAAAG